MLTPALEFLVSGWGRLTVMVVGLLLLLASIRIRGRSANLIKDEMTQTDVGPTARNELKDLAEYGLNTLLPDAERADPRRLESLRVRVAQWRNSRCRDALRHVHGSAGLTVYDTTSASFAELEKIIREVSRTLMAMTV